ncbi:MAG: iron ABC transporter permease [Myxococcaceae bacterium]|jgi:iron(III) transport system permease protein|nr:iron ABC transporter permease [Myxococcaceae bacterium]
MTRVLPGALAALLLATVFVPLGLLLARSGGSGDWLEAWRSPESRHALAGTLLTSGGASAIALALGVPFAWLIARTDVAARGALRTVVTLPSAIPPYLWTMGWIALANPRSGWLTLVVGRERLDVYGTAGIAFVLGTSALPLVVLATAAALERIDPGLEEAARLSGAGAFTTFRDVTLPLIAPATLSGGALVFVFASASFGVPYLLGVPANPPAPTLTTRIYAEVLMGEAGLARAASLSVQLLLVAVGVLAVNAFLSRAGRVRLSRGKGGSARVTALGPWRWPLSSLAWATAVAVIVLPLLAIFLTGLMPTWGQWGRLTLEHWSLVLQPRTLAAAGASALLGALAALLVGALGLAVAITRRRWLETLADAPSALPGTVLALALLVAFSRDVRFIAFERVTFVLALGNTLWLVLLSYVVKHLALGVRAASDALAQADLSLAEAARLSGAGRLRAFVDGVLPQLHGALVGAALLTFLTCVSELTMSVLLVPTGGDVLGTLLFELQSYADPASAAVIASALLLVVLSALVVQNVVARRAEARG